MSTQPEQKHVPDENHTVPAPKRKTTLEIGLKQFGYSLIILIFCVVIFATFLTDLDSVVWRIIVGLFSGAIFFIVIYASMNDFGVKDSDLERFHHIPRDISRGIKASLISVVPFLLFNLWFALTYVPPNDSMLKVIFNLVNCPVYWATALIGLENSTAIWVSVFLMPVLIAVVGFFGYYYGAKGISILEKILYKNKKSDSEEKSDGHDYRF